MRNPIGRKVVITSGYKNHYPEYIGQVGTIKYVGENDNYYSVEMKDGNVLMPYKPDHSTPQCTWYIETPTYPEYKVGQRVYVHSGDNMDRTGEGVIIKVDKRYCLQPCIEVECQNHRILQVYPSIDGSREFNVEILPEEPKDEKRYVRCIDGGYMQGTYTKGKEYEVVGHWEDTHTFIADTGRQFSTGDPERFSAPYTKTPEPKYRYDKIKGEKIVVWCSTQEEWDAVSKICTFKWNKTSIWGDYKSESCINPGGEGYADRSYYRRNNQIITAREFLADNQTTNITHMDKQAMQKQLEVLKAQMKSLEEQINQPEYKVGDWVVVLPTDDFYNNAEKGKAQQIVAMGGINKYVVKFSCGKTNSYNNVRAATEAEIAEATKPKVVIIGSGSTGVTIQKGKITGPDGKTVTIEAVRYLYRELEDATNTKGMPWTISDITCKIGCAESVKISQLKEVIREYDNINKS